MKTYVTILPVMKWRGIFKVIVLQCYTSWTSIWWSCWWCW